MKFVDYFLMLSGVSLILFGIYISSVPLAVVGGILFLVGAMLDHKGY